MFEVDFFAGVDTVEFRPGRDIATERVAGGNGGLMRSGGRYLFGDWDEDEIGEDETGERSEVLGAMEDPVLEHTDVGLVDVTTFRTGTAFGEPTKRDGGEIDTIGNISSGEF